MGDESRCPGCGGGHAEGELPVIQVPMVTRPPTVVEQATRPVSEPVTPPLGPPELFEPLARVVPMPAVTPIPVSRLPVTVGLAGPTWLAESMVTSGPLAGRTLGEMGMVSTWRQDDRCCCCVEWIQARSRMTAKDQPPPYDDPGRFMGHTLLIDIRLKRIGTKLPVDECTIEWYEMSDTHSYFGVDQGEWTNMERAIGRDNPVLGPWYESPGYPKRKRPCPGIEDITLEDHPRLTFKKEGEPRPDGCYRRYFMIRVNSGASCRAQCPPKELALTQELCISGGKAGRRNFRHGIPRSAGDLAQRQIHPPPFHRGT